MIDIRQTTTPNVLAIVELYKKYAFADNWGVPTNFKKVKIDQKTFEFHGRGVKLSGEGKPGTLAQVLAREAIFGEDMMKKCTPFGNSHLNTLPTAEMKLLKNVMFKQFPQFPSLPAGI